MSLRQSAVFRQIDDALTARDFDLASRLLRQYDLVRTPSGRLISERLARHYLDSAKLSVKRKDFATAWLHTQEATLLSPDATLVRKERARLVELTLGHARRSLKKGRIEEAELLLKHFKRFHVLDERVRQVETALSHVRAAESFVLAARYGDAIRHFDSAMTLIPELRSIRRHRDAIQRIRRCSKRLIEQIQTAIDQQQWQTGYSLAHELLGFSPNNETAKAAVLLCERHLNRSALKGSASHEDLKADYRKTCGESCREALDESERSIIDAELVRRESSAGDSLAALQLDSHHLGIGEQDEISQQDAKVSNCSKKSRPETTSTAGRGANADSQLSSYGNTRPSTLLRSGRETFSPEQTRPSRNSETIGSDNDDSASNSDHSSSNRAAANSNTSRIQHDKESKDSLAAAPPLSRFMLWIDGVGGYLVCPEPSVLIGLAVPDSGVQIPIQADISRRHARLRRCDEDYLLEPLGKVKLDGKSVEEKTILPDRCVIELGDGTQMLFHQPHALCRSARVDMLTRHRIHPWVDGVFLLSDALVLGHHASDHLVCPRWDVEITLFRRNNTIFCRASEAIELNGELVGKECQLNPNDRIVCGNAVLGLEQVPALSR